MKRTIGIILIAILFVSCRTTENKLTELSTAEKNYQLHLTDLAGINSNGYKHSFDDIDIQGSFKVTGRNLDLSIHGTGFFQYSNPENGKIFFSRDGELKINQEGYLLNSDGYFLEPRIKIWRPIEEIKIDQSGVCKFIEYDTNIEKTIKIVTYDRKDINYEKVGNYYIFTSFERNEDDKIMSGTLELRNYDILSKLMKIYELLDHFQHINKKTNYSFKIKLIRELIVKYKLLIRDFKIGTDINVYHADYQIFMDETLLYVDFLSLDSPDNI